MKTACVDPSPESESPGCREAARGAADAAPGDLAKTQACAPILLLGFNRPDLLRGLVGILAKVKPPKLYLAVDGPRPGREGEAGKCAECAAVLDHLDWPCKVEKLIRTENLGCRLAVTGAIDWFFSKEEEGIVLEDDCWPDPSFLRFATELLERYRDDPRIGIISGNNSFEYISDKNNSYRFTTPASIWGWATWARKWERYDPNPASYVGDFEDFVSKTALTRRRKQLSRRILSGLLNGQDTWDMQWSFTRLRNRWLDICPQKNLVSNKGFGTKGTHTGFTYDQFKHQQAAGVVFPLIHPNSVARDVPADRKTERRMFALLPRILTVVGCKFGRMGRFLAFVATKIERMWPSLFRV